MRPGTLVALLGRRHVGPRLVVQVVVDCARGNSEFAGDRADRPALRLQLPGALPAAMQPLPAALTMISWASHAPTGYPFGCSARSSARTSNATGVAARAAPRAPVRPRIPHGHAAGPPFATGPQPVRAARGPLARPSHQARSCASSKRTYRPSRTCGMRSWRASASTHDAGTSSSLAAALASTSPRGVFTACTEAERPETAAD